MYQYVYGKVTNLNGQSITLEINGQGLEIFVKNVNDFKLNQFYKVFAYDYIKENVELVIFGFLEYDELIIFKKLLMVNGIGPKSAIAILKNTTVQILVSFIKNGNVKGLNNIKGMQNKGENLVFELKNKLKEFEFDLLRYVNVVEILQSLKYSNEEINKALNYIPENLTDGEALKQCLRIINEERIKQRTSS